MPYSIFYMYAAAILVAILDSEKAKRVAGGHPPEISVNGVVSSRKHNKMIGSQTIVSLSLCAHSSNAAADSLFSLFLCL